MQRTEAVVMAMAKRKLAPLVKKVTTATPALLCKRPCPEVETETLLGPKNASRNWLRNGSERFTLSLVKPLEELLPTFLPLLSSRLQPLCNQTR
ncbi:hypothetical protein ACFX2A_034754 [Malus domestica]